MGTPFWHGMKDVQSSDTAGWAATDVPSFPEQQLVFGLRVNLGLCSEITEKTPKEVNPASKEEWGPENRFLQATQQQ